jgi:hypothetical protein
MRWPVASDRKHLLGHLHTQLLRHSSPPRIHLALESWDSESHYIRARRSVPFVAMRVRINCFSQVTTKVLPEVKELGRPPRSRSDYAIEFTGELPKDFTKLENRAFARRTILCALRPAVALYGTEHSRCTGVGNPIKTPPSPRTAPTAYSSAKP